MKINRLKSKCWILFFTLLLHTPMLLAKEVFSEKVIEHAKKSVVTIDVNAAFAAYGEGSKWSGTGCVVDKQHGYILTNQHVIGDAVVGSYKATFFNGIQQEAHLIYYDPWLDYGFVKVSPTVIPKEVTETTFSSHNPVIDQPIFIVGNNEGYSFSLHTGVVADLYGVTGAMPQQSIKLSLNTKGGSSGSPIFNKNGQAVGLNYAGNRTFGFAIHPEYIRYALSAIRQGNSPIRKQVGVITKSTPIKDVVQYDGLSTQQQYIKTFPNGATSVITVHHVLVGSPAAALLFPGDVIWAINGHPIGPNLVAFYMAMNKTTKDSVLLTIFRMGQWHDIKIGLYDLEAHKITKMVHFGGALFFEMDDYCAKLNHLSPKSLTFVHVDANHMFHNVAPNRVGEFRLKVLSFNKKSVADLQALVAVIPSLISKKYFTIEYTDLSPCHLFGSALHLGPRPSRAYVAYDTHLSQPRSFIWDEASHQWISSPIGIK
ncbi:Heat shock protease [Cardinium endosymbiont of Sogatella furcifera]|uniref:S1C family serine protease n=1 Tax=Cardinium endosymbiont of Sogatella furcifera TaxID=650378 RepID=UPI000E0D9D31|nr:S1C family serine protease [Cardinium endosymbiont of Sogatella furcifera]AXI24307.1 Heat shock protease [Cardinium endosymbiont of Sogatella furcifera]